MTQINDITVFAEEIAKRYAPEKIVLFGSYARKNATENSDVDLLVIMNYEGSSIQTALDIRKHIPFSHPLDLVIKKPNDFRWRIEQHDFFLQEILDSGVTLYEAAH